MTGRGLAGAVASLLAVSCGAPTHHSTTPALPPPAPRGPTSRFVPVGTEAIENLMDLPDGSTAVVSFGRRAVVRADGTEDGAPSIASGDDRGMSPLGGVPIPARLGGGYLFWATQLERAPTFLGPRSPVAPLDTNVIDVDFGHDALLLFGPQQSRRMYALDPPRQVPLSPHGVVATAGADDDRVVALDAAGRAGVAPRGAEGGEGGE